MVTNWRVPFRNGLIVLSLKISKLLCQIIQQVLREWKSELKFLHKPYKAEDWIKVAPILFVHDSYYVIGGRHGTQAYSNVIGRMDQGMNWTQAGTLQQARRAHNAIFDGESMIIVGGNEIKDLKTEVCSFQSDKSVSCTAQEPALTDYSHYPALFLVDQSFCKIKN